MQWKSPNLQRKCHSIFKSAGFTACIALSQHTIFLGTPPHDSIISATKEKPYRHDGKPLTGVRVHRNPTAQQGKQYSIKTNTCKWNIGCQKILSVWPQLTHQQTIVLILTNFSLLMLCCICQTTKFYYSSMLLIKVEWVYTRPLFCGSWGWG